MKKQHLCQLWHSSRLHYRPKHTSEASPTWIGPGFHPNTNILKWVSPKRTRKWDTKTNTQSILYLFFLFFLKTQIKHRNEKLTSMSPLGMPSNNEGLIQPSMTSQPPKFTPFTLESPRNPSTGFRQWKTIIHTNTNTRHFQRKTQNKFFFIFIFIFLPENAL